MGKRDAAIADRSAPPFESEEMEAVSRLHFLQGEVLRGRGGQRGPIQLLFKGLEHILLNRSIVSKTNQVFTLCVHHSAANFVDAGALDGEIKSANLAKRALQLFPNTRGSHVRSSTKALDTYFEKLLTNLPGLLFE